MKTALYRHFDASNNLLYVGVSLHALRRTREHRLESPWYSAIAKIDIQYFATREEALAAETSAIQTERPHWNKDKVILLSEGLDWGLKFTYDGTQYFDGWYSDYMAAYGVFEWLKTEAVSDLSLFHITSTQFPPRHYSQMAKARDFILLNRR